MNSLAFNRSIWYPHPIIIKKIGNSDHSKNNKIFVARKENTRLRLKNKNIKISPFLYLAKNWLETINAVSQNVNISKLKDTRSKCISPLNPSRLLIDSPLSITITIPPALVIVLKLGANISALE